MGGLKRLRALASRFGFGFGFALRAQPSNARGSVP
jgi:hypothetical protein